MSENHALHIHARVMPVEPIPTVDDDHGSSHVAPRHAAKPRHARARRKASAGERLLRNSALACALLLGILALGNVDQPWARRASEGVERALTMHIDIDKDIGALQFVRRIMPESALVFMNLSGESRPVQPVEGTVTHPWSNLQPWRMYACPKDSEVRAVADGTVTAVSPLSDDRVGVLIDHGEGLETLYASLDDVEVKNGDSVARGQVIGEVDDDLYFECRRAGEPVDPAEALGL